MEAENPYAPPVSFDSGASSEAALGELVRAWEKLRLIYNLALLFPGLGVLALWVTRLQMPLLMGILLSVVFGIAANCAFFLGPAAELYIRALFRQGRSIGKGRKFIFWAGIFVSGCVLILAALPAIFT
jgi:hypothetical protein